MKAATIKTMEKEERPYEKCEKYGAKNLTDIELLAVILRSGTKGESSLDLAKKLLYKTAYSDGLLNIHHWSFDALMRIRGIGKVKALQILCLSELCRRLAKETAAEGLDFSSPQSIAGYYMEDMRHLNQEQMKLLMLNTKTKLLGETDISKGTVNASLVSPRDLFIEALQKNAVSIVLLHNHPSGDPSPSREDLLITKRIQDAGKLIGIELLDHIIIGNNCYTSLREEGLFSCCEERN